MRTFLLWVLALSLTGCASNVVTDYDSTAEFDQYASWAFTSAAHSGDTSSIISLDGNRVRDAVERELGALSMQKVPEKEADLLVSWQIVEEERLERQGVGLGLGFGSGNFGWGISSAPPVREVEEGKLVIELVDAADRQVVWRAASRRYLNEDQSPATRGKLIDEVVAEMFSRYPPGAR